MLAPWDIAAGILLIREAGGVVTDLAGRAVGAEHTGLVAGNPAIHEWLLGVVRGIGAHSRAPLRPLGSRSWFGPDDCWRDGSTVDLHPTLQNAPQHPAIRL